jgi:hypothetical protein
MLLRGRRTLVVAGLAAAAAACLVRSRSAAGAEESYVDSSGKVLALATMMRRPTDVVLWLNAHRAAGVGRFYVRAEDSPDLVALLAGQPDVEVEAGQSGTDNYTSMQARQIAFVNRALDAAAAAGDVAWLFHVDADELLDGDFRALGRLPASVKTVKLQNAEALYAESEASCFSATKFVRCAGGGPCTSYANGKAGGRVEPGVRCAGPHDFSHAGSLDAATELPFEQVRVLHFDSCTIGAWLEKFAHLLKGLKRDASGKPDVPFPFYVDSMRAAEAAAAVYRAHKGAAREVAPEHVYTRR